MNFTNPYLQTAPEMLFVLSADASNELLAQLQSLLQQAKEPLYDLAKYYFSKFERKTYTLALVLTHENFEKEIQFAIKGIPLAIQNKSTWQSPNGSFFEPCPLGQDAQIVLVYPGAASAFHGLGKDLFQIFPDLLARFSKLAPHTEKVLFTKQLYPRLQDSSQKAPYLSPMAQMAVGVSFSAIFTQILTHHLQIKPAKAMGYSMGEASGMWYSLGVWSPENIEEVFFKSPIFAKRVAGEMQTLQEFWQVSAQEVQARWRSFALVAPVDLVKKILANHNAQISDFKQKIYLTFVNTPTETIVSGDRQTCLDVIEKAQIPFKEVFIPNVTHHEFVQSERDLFLKMHSLPILQVPPIDFYGGVPYRKLTLQQPEVSIACTELNMDTVDWVNQVETLYRDGGRIFMEMGANANCTRWVSEILKGKPHLAVAMNRKGFSDLNNLWAVLARLVCHQVPVDLSYFFTAIQNGQSTQKQLFKKIELGGQPIHEKVLTEEHIQFFRNFKKAQIKNKTQMLDLQTVTPQTNQQNLPRMGENGLMLQDYNDPNRLSDREIIWNEDDLREFAYGKIAKVFGQEYQIIDTYKRRVMLPKDPYLLVSRVTKLDAKRGEFKPSKMTTEYDIPYNSWFATDGQIPWAVAVESGQCDLLLISYIGIDFEAKGELVYRLLDCTITFLEDLALEGQTLRYDISINNYARSGQNLLFFFSYDCYIEDRLVVTMRNGCAGFFSNTDLEKGQGIIPTKQEIADRKNAVKRYFTPLLYCNKTSFDKPDLLKLCEGKIDEVFGEAYKPNNRNASLKLPPEAILMLDRIVSIDLTGGAWGLGTIVAEKDLHPDDWYFPCHFRDDEVLAGSLQADGGGQLLKFLMLYLGMQRLTKDARFQPVYGLPQKVRCRKEVTPNNKILTFKMEVKEIGLVPSPYIVADLEILTDGTSVVFFENLGLQLREKSNPKHLEAPKNSFNGVFLAERSKNAELNEAHITEFALGKVEKCFGEEYRLLDSRALSRQPNTDLQLISRVLKVDGQRGVFKNNPTMYSEYDVPKKVWYYDDNVSQFMPYSVLMEIALQPCGFLGAYLGITLQYADRDDLFIRNLDGFGIMTGFQDWRGKTIENKSIMTTYVALGGSLIQKYDFELYCEGKKFYEGFASFGFFTKENLSSQSGLDNGKLKATWLEENPNAAVKRYNFALPIVKKLFFDEKNNKAHYRLSNTQLHLVDELAVVQNGGKYGKGYAYGNKKISPSDWYFACHFYQDPVMPGSLGVESIMEVLQGFAIQQKIGENFENPRFELLDNNKTVWKYRGQILQTDELMQLEIHIKDIRYLENNIDIVADASLWKNKLRIYEVSDIGVSVRNA